MFRESFLDAGDAFFNGYVGVQRFGTSRVNKMSDCLMSISERRLLKCRLSRIKEGIEVAIGWR